MRLHRDVVGLHRMRELRVRIDEAECCEQEKRWRDAVNAWNTLARDEGDLKFLLRAAMAAENGGLLADAEQLYRETIAGAPNRAFGYFGLGSLLQKQDRLEEARRTLEQGLRLEEQPFVLTILGIVQRRLGDLGGAEKTLRRSLALDPTDDEAHFSLGLTLAKEEPLAAIELFRRALTLGPNLSNVHRVLGETSWRVNRYEEAEPVLRQALLESGDDAWSHYFIGNILGRRDDWAGAKGEFLLATTQQPSIGTFWRVLADACAVLDELTQAEHYYLRALSLAVDDPFANARYGLLLKRLGQFGKARAYLQRAVDLDPTQARAQEVLTELRASD